MISGSSRTVRYKFDKDGKMLKRFTWIRSSYNINNHSFEDEDFWEEDNPDFTEEEYNDPNFQAYIQAIKDGEFEKD